MAPPLGLSIGPTLPDISPEDFNSPPPNVNRAQFISYSTPSPVPPNVNHAQFINYNQSVRFNQASRNQYFEDRRFQGSQSPVYSVDIDNIPSSVPARFNQGGNRGAQSDTELASQCGEVIDGNQPYIPPRSLSNGRINK